MEQPLMIQVEQSPHQQNVAPTNTQQQTPQKQTQMQQQPTSIDVVERQPSNESILFPPPSPSVYRDYMITEINSLSNVKILQSEDINSSSYVAPVDSCLNWSHNTLPSHSSLHSEFGSIPVGVIFSPLKPLKLAPPVLMRPPTKCKSCSAYINCYCPHNFNNGRWQCVLCGSPNDNLEKHPGSQNEAKQLYPELMSNVVDYLDPQLAPSPLTNTLNDLSVLFLIDVNLKPKEMQSLKASISKAVESLPPTTQIGLLTFSTVISVYDLSNPALLTADVIDGLVQPTEEMIKQALPKARNEYVSQLSECGPRIGDILESVSSALQRRQTNQPLRCLGAAISTALQLISTTHGKIVVFLSGVPNYGVGSLVPINDQEKEYHKSSALQLYKQLSVQANEKDTTIDLFCAGLAQFESCLLQNLVTSNGGFVYMQKDFETDKYSKDLEMAVSRSVGRDGSIELRTSPNIELSHIIGSAQPIRKKKQEKNNNNSNSNSKVVGNQYRLGAVQSSLTLTLYFELNDDQTTDPTQVFFQSILKFLTRDNRCVLRVVTHRIPTSFNKSEILSGLDVNTISILIARKAVLTARKQAHQQHLQNAEQSQESEQALHELDSSLALIVKSVGVRDQTKKIFKLPENLSTLPKKLFSLRRGPALGPILQHADDIDFVRSLFLHSDYSDALRLMCPVLLEAVMSGPDGVVSFHELPLEDLALQSDKVLYLDHHTNIFIWSGLLTITRLLPGQTPPTEPNPNDRKRQACLQRAEQAAQHRVPQPEILQFKEASSMARWLQCRLIPSHKDSAEEQLQSFPQLGQMNADQRHKLMSKFHRTDDLSYNQYYRNICNK